MSWVLSNGIENLVGKKNPAGDPDEIARVQADIDARNPTKPINILVNQFL